MCNSALAHQAEAGTWFAQALARAQNQQAQSCELRTATSLARLWQRQRQARRSPRAARPGLRLGFTEGFDTADLQEAKALLEELRA